MDEILCDELIQDIFTKLPSTPSSSSSSVSLVSKRWLNLYRTSKTSLSLLLPSPQPAASTIPSLSSLLLNYPSLSSVSLIVDVTKDANVSFSDHLLSTVSSSCPNLKTLRFLAGPVSLSSLFSLSKTSLRLESLTLYVPRPLSLSWVTLFPGLKLLAINIISKDVEFRNDWASGLDSDSDLDQDLSLESLSVSGIQSDDFKIGFLWRNCKKLKKLRLKSCGSIGDGRSFFSCLKNLEEIEIRTCRSIVDGVLSELAEHCSSLKSLLLYDGGSREGLLQFIKNSKSDLQKLDLRLPLDLTDDHLLAVSERFNSLSVLRLQSCCLVTGEGLKSVSVALSSCFDELSLVNCDAVEREKGLIASLGQNLKRLRKLDLSFNDMLVDKELVSMLVSCNFLMELRIRGCKRITGCSVLSMFKNCKRLEYVDLVGCCNINSGDVELFVTNSSVLTKIEVEENKVSEVTRTWASNRFIEVVS